MTDQKATQLAQPASITDIPQGTDNDAHIHIDTEHPHTKPQDIKRTVVIAIDDSPEAKHAIEWAVHNVLDAAKDQVIVVHVREEPVFAYGDLATGYVHVVRQLDAETRKASRNILTKAMDQLHAANDKLFYRGISAVGDPRYEILAQVEKHNANLLITGSRGQGALKRMVLGSVSDYLVHHAKCCVLVVRDQSKQE